MFIKPHSTTLATTCLLMCVAAASGVVAQQKQQKKVQIGDKTLVAWVQLANLDQQAGGALAIQDFDEFDAIVFGEVRPKTWMPGSHRFHRTNTQQDSWPQESVGPDQLVQVAIVYQGSTISLYRNGQLATQYETDRAHVFGAGLRAAIGMRHVRPFPIPVRCFAGKVEEARIYDRALSGTAIAALKSGTPSAVKPLAQWSFEDGTPRDEMGYFSQCTLRGGAFIADGKLHLDGKDDCLSTGVNYASRVQRRESYAQTLPEQLEQLKTDPQVLRFARSRKQLAADPYRPVYHYVNPEGNLNDPNGLCTWQGRYHLFYQAFPPEAPRQHWGHAISEDLVHWTDLPLAIYPGIEDRCHSGSTLVEEDRVVAMYHGYLVGNMVAVSSDPLLLNWKKIPGNPVIPYIPAGQATGRPYRITDPCIWKEKQGYYSLSGTHWKGAAYKDCTMVQQLFFSRDLRNWKYLGPFVEGTGFTEPGEDGAVPYFWPIGDKHILVFASHPRGSQYLLGDYDTANHRFKPFAHGRFNYNMMNPGGVHAPSAMPDGKGGVYVINNLNKALPTQGWDQLMSLVRVLTLREDNTLGIEPVAAVESLRGDTKSVGERTLEAGKEIVLDGIAGNAMELAVELDPKTATDVTLNVLRSPGAEEYTKIMFSRTPKTTIGIDVSHASLHKSVQVRPPEIGPLALADGEPLKLRVFIDKSVVEVFANGRQCVAVRVYPQRKDSLGVWLRATGGDAVLKRLDAWQMNSIYTESKG